jgi:hypothetical protein
MGNGPMSTSKSFPAIANSFLACSRLSQPSTDALLIFLSGVTSVKPAGVACGWGESDRSQDAATSASTSATHATMSRFIGTPFLNGGRVEPQLLLSPEAASEQAEKQGALELLFFETVEYLLMDNQVLKEKLGKNRILPGSDQRRRLAVRGKILGRKMLEQLAGIVTPDAILRWRRELVARH